MPATTMPANELDGLKTYFDTHRHEWITLGHQGQWVVLGASFDHRFFAHYKDAVRFAVKTYGQQVCLIQQLLPKDPIATVQHVFFKTLS